MGFFSKFLKSKKTENEPEYTFSEIKSTYSDNEDNVMSYEEVEKTLELSRKQQAEGKIRQGKRQEKIDALKSKGTEPTEWLSAFLDKCEATYSNVSNKQIKDLYFENMSNQKQAQKDRNYKEAYLQAQLSLALVDRFIQSEYEQVGSFCITGVPAIEFGMHYTSIMGLTGQFKNIKDVVNYFPEINLLYKEDLSNYEKLLKLSKQIRKLIKTNNSVLQNTLKKEFPEYEPSLISESCNWMKKFGLLNSEKVEKTYKLTLTY